MFLWKPSNRSVVLELFNKEAVIKEMKPGRQKQKKHRGTKACLDACWRQHLALQKRSQLGYWAAKTLVLVPSLKYTNFLSRNISSFWWKASIFLFPPHTCVSQSPKFFIANGPYTAQSWQLGTQCLLHLCREPGMVTARAATWFAACAKDWNNSFCLAESIPC